MNEKTKHSLERLRLLIEKYNNDCIKLAKELLVSNTLFFLFLALTVIVWLTGGLSYVSCLTSLVTACLWFDGQIIKSKVISIIISLVVLNDLHGTLSQSINLDELAP
jgi:hypothetical protein